ncbi:MAG: hypothetical protein WDN67_04540 [Candidatus Moraniibacteriota bacterium]
MKSGFDINRIQEDGYLILPLSMSRLATGQNAEFCYSVLEEFVKKIETFSNDVVLLYTNGLYFNSEEVSFENRKKTTKQALAHILEFRNIIEKKKRFIPGAIHYLPIDYVLFNSPHFKTFFDKLKALESEDPEFKRLLIEDSRDKRDTEANINFLLEEIAVAHILRQKLVELPRTLVKSDSWRLIAYPGKPLFSDIYQWKKKVLPQKEGVGNPFAGAQYNLEEKHLILFDETET